MQFICPLGKLFEKRGSGVLRQLIHYSLDGGRDRDDLSGLGPCHLVSHAAILARLSKRPTISSISQL